MRCIATRLGRAATIVAVLALGLGAGSARAEEVVVAAETALYREGSSTSGRLKALPRGRRVVIDFVVSSSQGPWCRVREVELPGAEGYVPCTVLEKTAVIANIVPATPVPPPPAPETVPTPMPVTPPVAVPPPAPPARFPPSSARPAPPATGSAAVSPSALPLQDEPVPPTMRIDVWKLVTSALDPDPSFWAKRLGLTEAQRRRAVEVSTRTGWRDCHLQLRSVPFGAPWSAERCRPSFAVFWRDFAALLTKEQLARLEADERAVEEYTGIRVRTLYRAD